VEIPVAAPSPSSVTAPRSSDGSRGLLLEGKSAHTLPARRPSEVQTVDASNATVTFQRSGVIGVLRRLRVFIDGEQVLSLGHDDQLSVTVDPGEHVIHTKMDWCRSNSLRVECQPEQPVIVDCGCRPFPVAVFMLVFPPFRIFRVTRIG